MSLPQNSPLPSIPASTLSRRRFLTGSLATGALLGLLPRSVARAADAASGPKLRVAFVGIGHRGRAMVEAFAQSGLVDLTAFCDVDLGAPHTLKILEAFPDVPTCQDFRVLFDQFGDRFEAVVIATPDHSHFPITMEAMRRGKHVYVEKPLAHTFQEVELLMALAERTGVVTQMGNQGHSGNNFHQFKAWTEAGVVKDITKVVAFMNSPRRWHGWTFEGYPEDPNIPATLDWDLWHTTRPLRPYSERLHPGDWRSWFEFGNGAFGDWGPHILDTAHRFLRLGLPHRIEAVHREGVNPYFFPQASTIRFDFAARGAMPPVEVFWYDGVNNRPPVPEGMTPESAAKLVNGKYLFGKDLSFQGGTHGSTIRVIPEEKMRQLAPQLPRVPTGFSNHVENFVLACQGREEPQSPFHISGPLTQVFLLGVIAQRIGGRLDFDPVAKRFTNNPEATALLTGAPPRPGWESYYKV